MNCLKFTCVLFPTLFAASAMAQSQGANFVSCKSMPSVAARTDANTVPMLAKLTSDSLIEQMRNGAVAEYLEVRLKPNSAPRFVPLSSLLAIAINVNEPLIISWTSADLKFLPSVQQESQIILIASDSNLLDSAKIQAVIATANRLAVTIHTVLLHDDDTAAATLIKLSSATGGKILDLRTSSCHSAH